MKHKKTKSAIFTVLSLLIFSVPALAQDDDAMGKNNEGKKEIKDDSPKTDSSKIKEDAPQNMEHHEMVDKVNPDARKMLEEQEYKNYKKDAREFKRAFIEGTLNVISPYTYRKDSLYILYSHNFYTGSFPRGSNPAFHFSYSPIKNFQLDTIFSLRYSPLEFEIGGKYVVMNEFEGAPISLAPRVSYNTRANVVGLDVSASKIFFEDVLQVGLGYRAIGYFGDPKIDDLSNKFAQGLGVNAIYRFYKDWNLFGDVVLPFDSTLLTNHGFIWSAGIKKIIPRSPHILTLYVGNSNESTLTGRTISTGTNKYPDLLKVGFQFSIDIPRVSHFLETVL